MIDDVGGLSGATPAGRARAGDLIGAARLMAEAADLAYLPDRDVAASTDATTDDLVALLRTTRPDEKQWWLDLALAWSAIGLVGMARACLARGRALAVSDQRADWATLERLAALDVRLRQIARPAPPDPDEPADPRPWAEPREPAASKRSRLAEVVRSGFTGFWEPTGSGEVPHTDAMLLGGGGLLFSADLAEEWFRRGEYRLVVEQFVASMANSPVSRWLGAEDELTWVGRALLRLGDQVSAYACFRIASLHQTRPEPADGQDRPQPEMPVAMSYLDDMPELGADLVTGPEPYRLFHRGARLGDFLSERNLEAYYLKFVPHLRNGAFRRISEILDRQLDLIGQRSGWFSPEPTATARLFEPAIRLAVGAVPPPRRRVPAGAPISFRLPSLLDSEPLGSDAGTSRVRIGVSTTTDDYVLNVSPATRCMMLGAAPRDAGVVESLVDQLQAQGWVVVWLAAEAPGVSARYSWHHVSLSDDHTSGPSWIDEFARSAALRRAVTEAITRLYAGTDRDLAMCLEYLVEHMVAEDGFSDTEVRKPLDVALESLQAIRLRLTGPAVLRRTAHLIDRLTYAATTLHRVLTTAHWRKPYVEVSPGRTVRIDVHGGDPEAEQIFAVLCLASFSDAVDSYLPASASAESPYSEIDLGLAEDFPSAPPVFGEEPMTTDFDWWVDAPITPRPRRDHADLEDIAAAVRDAESSRTREPESPEAGPTASSASIWTSAGLLPPDRTARTCVVITGSLGAVWPIALSGLADEPGVGTTALVTGISTPSAEDLRTCSRYPQFVVGRLGPALCDQFSVAAGVQVTADRTEGLGDLGALRIAVHDRCLVIERLVLWPGDNSGEIR